MNAGNAELALEWVTYCWQHPSIKREVTDRADSLRSELLAMLTMQQIEAAKPRTQARTLESLEQEILAAG